ncbi:Hypothetical predicted protein [Pelobates cultripes]|uniref:Uncharacterized protein n=1 Tax=Pelobates cultripes TaxID=61616 RepID=A0AAD1S8I9_PELCU|nr:Hypothetical predicted protein [Pelobates cultripes]
MDKFIDKTQSKRMQGKSQRPTKKIHLKAPTPATTHRSPTRSDTDEGPTQMSSTTNLISQQASETAREVSNLLKPIFESQFKDIKESIDGAVHLLQAHSSQLAFLETRQGATEDEVHQLQTTICQQHNTLISLQDKLDDLENRSNLRFVGFPESIKSGNIIPTLQSCYLDTLQPPLTLFPSSNVLTDWAQKTRAIEHDQDLS